jgi:hypothetical protein
MARADTGELSPIVAVRLNSGTHSRLTSLSVSGYTQVYVFDPEFLTAYLIQTNFKDHDHVVAHPKFAGLEIG